MSIFKLEELQQSVELTERFVTFSTQLLGAETLLTAWQRASLPSSSPIAQWCGFHPGRPKQGVCRPLRRENQKALGLTHIESGPALVD